MRFDRTPPPARRATDRYISVGFAGVALLGIAAVARAVHREDWIAVVMYAPPTAVVSYAAAGLVTLVLRARLRRHENRG